MWRLICLILVSQAVSYPLCAQNSTQPWFEHVAFRPGISQYHVTDITQDDAGFIWAGTRNGLFRHDGYSFKRYVHNPESENTISNNSVRFVLPARDGYLAVVTVNTAVDYLDTATGAVRRLPLPEGRQILHAMADSQGRLWFTLANGGLLRLDQDKLEFALPEVQSAEGFSLETLRITQISVDSADTLWLSATGLAPLLLDLENATLSSFKQRTGMDYPFSNAADPSVLKDNDGNVWLAPWGGSLHRIDPIGKEIVQVIENEARDGRFIREIVQDHENAIWAVPHQDGVIRILPGSNTIQHLEGGSSEPGALGNSKVQTIFVDEGGVVWVGTANGLYKYSRYKRKFDHLLGLDDSNDAEPWPVQTVFELPDGTILVGAEKRGTFIIDQDGKIVRPLLAGADSGEPIVATSAAIESGGTLLIGTSGNGLLRYDADLQTVTPLTKQQYVTDIHAEADGRIIIATFVNGIGTLQPGRNSPSYWRPGESGATFDASVLFKDSNGNLWAGSDGDGVVMLYQDRARFLHFRANEKSAQRLSDERVLAIAEDDQGYIWIGTRNGLNRIEPDTWQIESFYEGSLLPDNTVCSIINDGNGLLWVSTYNGLLTINTATMETRVFRLESGTQDVKFNPGAAHKGSSGRLYLGGVNGISTFQPEKVPYNRRSAPLRLTAFGKQNEVIESGGIFSRDGAIHLKHNENFFSFYYALMDFTDPGRNSFQYKLDGIDSDWVNGGTQPWVHYTNIDPGNYTFMVRGRNPDGTASSNLVTVPLIVEPPFWQTWEFRIAVVLVMIASVAGLFHWRTRTLQAQKSVLEKEVAQRRVAQGELEMNQSRLREMASRLTVAEELERRRLASQLHDKIGHGLFNMKAIINSEEQTMRSKGFGGWIDDLKGMIDETVEDTRLLTVEISPPSLHKFGLESALEKLIERFGERTGVKTAIMREGKSPVSHDKAVLIYQSVRELLVNIEKHAGARLVELTISRADGMMIISISDDGRGFDSTVLEDDNDITSYGLFSIRQRMESIGGSLELSSTKDSGTTATLKVPVEKKRGP